ncbi:MAG: hypothetical protein IKQ61_04930 [Spirochaetales bacterium]|nr:hypothetical protein [Spirochaetales bacterium]MBR6199591.1 hypothetical protein [Spirochaetales bacterium]
MTSVNAYYDGHSYITEGSLAIKPNQRVIITVLDDFIKPKHKSKRNFKKYIGAITDKDSDIIEKAVEECRKVDLNEW